MVRNEFDSALLTIAVDLAVRSSIMMSYFDLHKLPSGIECRSDTALFILSYNNPRSPV